MSAAGNPLARHGGLSYLHIPALDPHRSARFYERLFGWRVDHRGGDDFRFSDPAGLLIGAWVSQRAVTQTAGFVPYLYVDDIARVTALAADSGGAVIEPVHTEGDVLIAQVRDPAGNAVGVWQFVATSV